MGTSKLYRDNAYTIEFDARVISQAKTEAGFELVLNRTAFYPTGGGQPFDTGWIDGIPVTDVQEREGEIVHIMKGQPKSETVSGRVDWQRRFDHMQQHAGQHILSAAFAKIAGANTVGFHLGSRFVYIDLDLQHLTEGHITRAEQLANKIVFDNLAIKTYTVEPENISKLPLRKPPAVKENIRIVEIDGFDYSPCGGTHPARTGSVGLIKIRRWEKSKSNIRIEFLCGGRALEDFRGKNESINRICAMLSVRDFEVADTVERIVSDNKALQKTIGGLKEDLCEYEARALVGSAPLERGIKIIKALFGNRPFEELRLLASLITGNQGCIAMLCSTGEKGQLIAGRSEDVKIDIREPFKAVMSQYDGRGGGNNRMVQGGFENVENAKKALDMLYNQVLKKL